MTDAIDKAALAAKGSLSTIEFSVRVMQDGKAKFESSIAQPLFASPERQKAATEAWMEMMAAGLRMSQLLREESSPAHEATDACK